MAGSQPMRLGGGIAATRVQRQCDASSQSSTVFNSQSSRRVRQSSQHVAKRDVHNGGDRVVTVVSSRGPYMSMSLCVA